MKESYSSLLEWPPMAARRSNDRARAAMAERKWKVEEEGMKASGGEGFQSVFVVERQTTKIGSRFESGRERRKFKKIIIKKYIYIYM